MNEKQYLRANKRVFLAVTIIFAYITLTMLAALAASHGDHFVRIMIQCLVSVGVIILSALGYLTRKKTHTCAIILTTAMMVGYAAVALLNTTEGTWAYALPLIIAAMVYLNERLMKIINSVFLLVNIVRLMLSFAPHASAALANKVLALFVLLLVAYASISITRMLVLFFDENMTEITEAADKQKKNHDQMLLVAENISRRCAGHRLRPALQLPHSQCWGMNVISVTVPERNLRRSGLRLHCTGSGVVYCSRAYFIVGGHLLTEISQNGPVFQKIRHRQSAC